MLVTLVHFDAKYDCLCSGAPIGLVQEFKLVHRANTAMLDAVGWAIEDAVERLKKMSEAERPGFVFFVIVTDGKENASTEFTLEQIQSMITRQQSEHGWQFSFPAADQDAFRDGQQMEIAASSISSFNRDRIGESLDIMQHRVARQRRQLSGGETIDVNFTIEDRRAMP